VSTGIPTLIAPLLNVTCVGAAQPDFELVDDLTGEYGAPNVYLVCLHEGGKVRARMFSRLVEGGEDPATGSAAGPLVAYLAERGQGDRVEISQGVEMRRPSRLLAEMEDGRPRVNGLMGDLHAAIGATQLDVKGLMGPGLSHVASQRKLSAIREALTKTKPMPSPGYQRVRIVTGAGETISGILKNEHNFSLQVLGSDNTLHVFVRDELREVIYEPDHLMPGDFDQRLTPSEFEDLLAFLSRLGSRSSSQGLPGQTYTS